jgi:type I restriction enzyme R subunit
VGLGDIDALPTASLDRLIKLADWVDRLISPDPLRKDFLAHAKWVTTLYQAVKPDPAVVQFSPRVNAMRLIADAIRERLGEEPADISSVLAGINALLDDSIEAFRIREKPDDQIGRRHGVIDISRAGPGSGRARRSQEGRAPSTRTRPRRPRAELARKVTGSRAGSAGD